MFFGGNSYGRISPTSPTRNHFWAAATSPFRNTQMPPFHDISVNQTALINGNARSPGKGSTGGTGSVIASGGRTMKDYEDQLGTLQKENFQLKLRVYFLEERMGISSLGGTDEDPMKKNIELKVEVEALKEEVKEKQELLSQAAKAFELQEEQKQAASKNEAEYKTLLVKERQKIALLEKNLEEYKEKLEDPSTYFKQVFGISEESVLENKEELMQMKEFVESLEVEVRQLSESLEEERSWAQELETERDELKQRLEAEVKAKEKLTIDKDTENVTLREKIKELEEELFKEKTLNQQNQMKLSELEQILKDKVLQLEEKCRVCEELNLLVDKRKKQIDQLRSSVKSRDDALADVNSKYRALRNQVEGSFRRISPPSSPSTLEDSSRSESRNSGPMSPTRISYPFDWEPKSSQTSDEKELLKRLEEKDTELKIEEEAKKQLILKLCNVQQSADQTKAELKSLKAEHNKALMMIQEFLTRQSKWEEKHQLQDKRVAELEAKVKQSAEKAKNNTTNSQSQLTKVNLIQQINDQGNGDQQRFEEMEEKLADLKAEMEDLRREKAKLEAEIQLEKQVEDIQTELMTKDSKIEALEQEKEELKSQYECEKSELLSLKAKLINLEESDLNLAQKSEELNVLNTKLESRNVELELLKSKVENLTRELQMKTQSLQKLVNTELWNKNKEIAKLHNHMTVNQHQEKLKNRLEEFQDCQNQLDNLMKHLNDVGIRVKFMEEGAVYLNYMEDGEIKDIRTLLNDFKNLQKNLETLKNASNPIPSNLVDDLKVNLSLKCQPKELSTLLHQHLETLVASLKQLFENFDEQQSKEIISTLISNSKRDLSRILEEKNTFITRESNNSDSETFSEPDRNVSFARMGLQEPQSINQTRNRFGKYYKTFSDSEDSLNYVPFHKTYHDLNEITVGLDHLEVFKDRKSNEMLVNLNVENENLRKRLQQLEEEHFQAKENVTVLKKDLDRLTLNHSQILVENTKLTNDKLRLEQELRKVENRFELNFKTMQQKFNKQIAELEAVNKEIENSDSAPSSSGVSSVPTEIHLKHDDVLGDFSHFSVNSSHFWVNYPTSGRSKSSCSPDLGIESDAALSTIRPLKSTLKITESMNNLLSDEDKSTNDRDSPLHLQGLDEVESLKQENEALKRRLVKTRRALEDTFHHLTTSNKNKKNVEKAITKQLLITKNILKKTRNYDEQIFQN